ncbi:MAG TPA: hypothetical protein VLK25_04240 [Allosphingosinicella sp.]|nr:hypothetical protein [Allosphingosinicella sp.]
MRAAAAASLLALTLAGCAREGDISSSGIITRYTACPPVAIAAPTGDVTLFNPANSRDARAIDVVAQITNVRSTCDETGEYIVTQATFVIQAQRRDTSGARDVVLPYYGVVVQGESNVIAKRVSRAGLHFEAGQARAQTTGTASSRVLAYNVTPVTGTNVFQYFGYTTATPPAATVALNSVAAPTLSSTNYAKVARIVITLRANPPGRVTGTKNTTTLQDEVYVRLANPNDNVSTDTTCV